PSPSRRPGTSPWRSAPPAHAPRQPPPPRGVGRALLRERRRVAGEQREWSIMTTRLTPADAWEGFVGDQSLAEFMHLSLAAGHDTPEAAVAAYLDDSYDDLTRDIQDPISREEL